MSLTRVSLGPALVWCTNRWGGVSAAPYESCNVGDHVDDAPDAVASNRDRVAAEAGLGDPTGWVWMRQVHGVDVHVATGPTGPEPPVADAAVTATRGLALAVVTADCAPIALACDDAVHAPLSTSSSTPASRSAARTAAGMSSAGRPSWVRPSTSGPSRSTIRARSATPNS